MAMAHRCLKAKQIQEVTPTKEMHHEAIVIAVDVGGRIGLELDRHVSHGGVEFKSRDSATVLSQDVGREVITVIKRQYVVLTKMKTIKEHNILVKIMLYLITVEFALCQFSYSDHYVTFCLAYLTHPTDGQLTRTGVTFVEGSPGSLVQCSNHVHTAGFSRATPNVPDFRCV